MSEEELKARIERNLAKNEMIDTETGLKAVQIVGAMADAEQTAWALVGGIAMHLYGSPRLTKDVDLIADKILSLKAEGQLSFGGEHYTVTIKDRGIPIDWIVRRDKWREFYHHALQEAVQLPSGWRIITPEWLLVLKYVAGRHKDELDMLWLLQQKDLVNRRLVHQHLRRVLGELQADLIFREIERRYCALADSGREGDENESYRPTDFSEYPDDKE